MPTNVTYQSPGQVDALSKSLLTRWNAQRKTVWVLSNGVGLANILAKCQLLNQPVPIIREAEGEFLVTLPLIQAGNGQGAPATA